jgi:hypothetical protein
MNGSCDTGSGFLAMATDPLLWAILALGVTCVVAIILAMRAYVTPPNIQISLVTPKPEVTAGSILRHADGSHDH